VQRFLLSEKIIEIAVELQINPSTLSSHLFAQK